MLEITELFGLLEKILYFAFYESKSLINSQYCQPARHFYEFESYLKTFLAKSKTTDKKCFLVGDLNLTTIVDLFSYGKKGLNSI